MPKKPAKLNKVRFKDIKITGQDCGNCPCKTCRVKKGKVECYKCADTTCLELGKRVCKQVDIETWRRDTLVNEFGKNPDVAPRCSGWKVEQPKMF